MNAETKPAKHSAPGQYLGYALQPVRVFYHLLTSPKGAKVSLEFKDDVAVHQPSGQLLLEQTKSALRQNPVSDWAGDLWKAFENWRAMIVGKEIDAGATNYRLYVTPLKKGDFVQALSAADDVATAEAALKVIRAKLAKRKTVPSCAEHLQPFLDAPAEQQTAIVTRFALDSEGADPLDVIRAVLLPVISENQIDIIIKSGIGQAKQALDRLIQRGERPILDADAFRRDFHAFVRQNNMPGLLMSFAGAPSDDLVADIASTRPTFIRQLEFVEANDEERLRAVSDYLRASADKADWADRGVIFPGSLDTWDDDLVRRHGMIRGDVSDLHSDRSVPVQGRLVYRQCAQYQAPLDGRVVPGHFVHGSFNDLADRRRIGWHADYGSLLGETPK
ncbi:ABC-three component system protein [Erythrobacter sp.]|uniref:ABC-three component system protein n=1 Tax=Erythrobacter sp. TaxID=1042 RepID=UPI0025EF8649|nr:ABC-three component system protein [Erythrobacter sp.]